MPTHFFRYLVVSGIFCALTACTTSQETLSDVTLKSVDTAVIGVNPESKFIEYRNVTVEKKRFKLKKNQKSTGCATGDAVESFVFAWMSLGIACVVPTKRTIYADDESVVMTPVQSKDSRGDVDIVWEEIKSGKRANSANVVQANTDLKRLLGVGPMATSKLRVRGSVRGPGAQMSDTFECEFDLSKKTQSPCFSERSKTELQSAGLEIPVSPAP